MALALLLSLKNKNHAERHKEETNIGKMERIGLMPPRFVFLAILWRENDKRGRQRKKKTKGRT